MKFLLLCKRYYTNRDLIEDRFGRLFHLPLQLVRAGNEGLVMALDYRDGNTVETRVDDLRFVSLPLTAGQVPKFPGNLRRGLNSFRPDLVIASGDSHIGALGALVARRRSIPFVFDVYDDYRVFGTNRIPGMKLLFRFALRRADLVIFASELLQRQTMPRSSSSLVLENGVDRELFRRIDREEARAAAGVADAGPVIGYFGSIGSMHGVETLIEATRSLRADYPGLCLLLAGQLGLDLDLDLDLQLPWIDYRGLIDQTRVPGLINACDVAVIPYHRGPQVDVSNACKLAEYLACEVPVVSTDVADYAKYITDAPQAICKPGDAADLARSIKAQIEHPRLAPFPGMLAWESLGRRLSAALGELVVRQ
jgi:glycosyltransferase involved in cell wall biosynthesis